MLKSTNIQTGIIALMTVKGGGRSKTLTYDNGKEFVAHGLIDQQLNSPA